MLKVPLGAWGPMLSMHHINNNETHAQVYCTKQRLWRRTQNSEQIPLPL